MSKLEGNINHVLCFVLCVGGSRDHNKSPYMRCEKTKSENWGGVSRGLRILPKFMCHKRKRESRKCQTNIKQKWPNIQAFGSLIFYLFFGHKCLPWINRPKQKCTLKIMAGGQSKSITNIIWCSNPPFFLHPDLLHFSHSIFWNGDEFLFHQTFSFLNYLAPKSGLWTFMGQSPTEQRNSKDQIKLFLKARLNHTF